MFEAPKHFVSYDHLQHLHEAVHQERDLQEHMIGPPCP